MTATSSLFDLGAPTATNPVSKVFAGDDYQPDRDRARLTTQIGCILKVVTDGNWRTVTRLALELRRLFPTINFPENSIQAQLRNLRKLGYTVERRNVAETGVCYEYRLLQRVNPGVGLERMPAGVTDAA